MMKWEAEQKGYTCNDCYLSMQNCHNKSICCEDETGLCDFFEELSDLKENKMNNDSISRQAAIDALWKALYEYEDKTEKQFQESEDLNVEDWIGHRIFVQNMNDIDRQTILNLPSAQSKDWMERNKERILQAGIEGREIEFRIGGRLFAIREKAQ